MIFVIDNDFLMAKCVKCAVKKLDKEARIFSDAIDAMDGLGDELPEMIFLEILLTGPDGFTLLNELVSYSDTARIPIVIVSTIDFSQVDLSNYGVVGVLNKETMMPEEIQDYVKKYAK
ncbi:MAG: response regulator [Candidatus Saccharibacteria bacterium]|nr:response regulator [Candidatus Saccharibacteria bacterium]